LGRRHSIRIPALFARSALLSARRYALIDLDTGSVRKEVRMARATTVNKPRGGKAIGRSQCAVGYARRSTDRQEQSIPDQQRAIETYAEEHGLRLLRFYIDDAISGTTTVGRQAFQDTIADATSADCGFGVILVYDVKRFGRIDNDEAGYYRHILRQHGVEVIYVSEGFTGDGTDDLLRPVKQWQARQESKDLSKVAIRGLLSKSSSGGGWWMGGAPPFGYDLRYESQSGEFLFFLRYLRDGKKEMRDQAQQVTRTLERGESVAVSRRDRCKLVPSERCRIETVQRVFHMYTVEQRGFKAIADALNRDQVPTSRAPGWAAHYTGRWSISAVRSILMNPIYVGDLVWNRRTDARFHRISDGKAIERRGIVGRRLEPNHESDWIVIPNAHEPLISRRTIEAAKALLGGREASRLQLGINPRTGLPVNGDAANGECLGGWSGPRVKFLLSQLCRCDHCGSRYEGHTQYRTQRDENGRRVRAFEYACGGYIRQGRAVCKLGAVPKEPFEVAVIDAVIRYYERYCNEEGQALLAEVLDDAIECDHERLGEEKRTLRSQLAKMERTIKNLLDNITPVNRELVDARLVELKREQSQLEERLEAVEHRAISHRHVQDAKKELRSFLDGLEAALRHEALDTRQATIRRCIKQVIIDHARREAIIAIRQLPILGVTVGREVAEEVTLRILSRRQE
jgi:DNA invertase Pin-like site-specific DNA recombinase